VINDALGYKDSTGKVGDMGYINCEIMALPVVERSGGPFTGTSIPMHLRAIVRFPEHNPV